MSTARDRLKVLASDLSEQEASEVLRFLEWLHGEEGESLTPAEYRSLDRSIAEAKAGKTRPWRQIRRKPA